MEKQMSDPRLDQPEEFGVVHHLQRHHSDPFAVVADPGMSVEDKRAMLADWASDARAVRDYPALRRLDTGAVVDINSVLSALKQLDEIGADHRNFLVKPHSGLRMVDRTDHEARPLWQFWKDDDDDDPPPCPAAARPWKPRPLLDATSSLMVA